MTGARAVSPRKIPSQRRSLETVERILSAAARVFAEEGVAATTDRIAARAGVSIGSLYQYFPNKDALLLELAQRHLRHSTGPLREALRPGRPSSQWLPEAVQLVADLHADVDLHRLMYDRSPRTPELEEHFRDAQVALRDAVALLLRDEYGLTDAAGTASILVALVESLTHRLVGEVPHPVLEREVLGAAVAYLASVVESEVT